MAKLIFGCGYLGNRVAALWRAAGEEVFAITRSPQRAENWRAAGLSPLVADITDPATLRGLPQVETVLFAVGYDRSSGQPIENVYRQGLVNVLEQLPPPARFIYISSTGVYGQVAGDWVDEDAPCRPQRAGGVACLQAEQTLQASPLAARTIVLRLAGIYGPGRIPRADDIRSGKPIDAPGDGYLNLIHVDDAARIVVATEQLPAPRSYVVSDGQPVLRRDYYGELARLLGAEPPQFTAPPVDSPAAQRAGSDKRVRPTRLFADLPLKLQYPDYRAGLAAIVQSSATG